MRIDWYTKGVLTVIAVLLAMIAFRQYVSPNTVVQAQESFAGVEFSGSPLSFFDSRTGDMFVYDGVNPAAHLRLTALGAPLVSVK